MESTVRLFNAALGRLGGEQLPLNISSLEDNTLGILCQNVFPHVLDLTLDAHDWSFALKRVDLARLTPQSSENRNYRFRFKLPSESVRSVRLEGVAGVNRSPAYIIEEDAILTNSKEASLVYVARITEPRRWPPKFADALIWKMAAELCSARNNDLRKQMECEQAYEVSLSKAVAADRVKQNRRPAASTWSVARGNVRPRRDLSERE